MDRLYGTHSVEAALQVMVRRRRFRDDEEGGAGGVEPQLASGGGTSALSSASVAANFNSGGLNHPHRTARRRRPTLVGDAPQAHHLSSHLPMMGSNPATTLHNASGVALFIRDFRYAAAAATQPTHSGTTPPPDAVEVEEHNRTPSTATAATKTKTSGVDDDGHSWLLAMPPKRKYPALHRITDLAAALGIPIVPVQRHALHDLCGERRNQHVVLQIHPFRPTPIAALPPVRSGEVLLVLDRVVDPMNVGAIVRAAYFFGVRRVVLSHDCASCTPVVSRSSAGTLEWMHVYRATKGVSTAQLLAASTTTMKDTKRATTNNAVPPLRVIGTVASSDDLLCGAVVPSSSSPLTTPQQPQQQQRGNRQGDAPCSSLPPTTSTTTSSSSQSTTTAAAAPGIVMVLGNEDAGLPAEILQHCTEYLHIPSGADPTYQARGLSLNVAGSAAVLLATLTQRLPLVVKATTATSSSTQTS